VLAGLVSLLAATALTPPAPAAAAEPGWRPLFAADFTGDSLPVQCAAYDGPHGGQAANFYRPDEVRVADGMLRLSMSRREHGGRAYTSGGVGCFRVVQAFGRYEFRAKAPAGVGMDAYATLWPADLAVEHHAALVEILARPGDEKMYLSNEYGTGESNHTVPGSYSDDFHTYTVDWTPTAFRVYVDGQLKMRDKRGSTVPRWIGFALSSGDPLTGVPDAATRLPAEFLVDWVRVYEYAPDAVDEGSPVWSPAQPGPASAPAMTPPRAGTGGLPRPVSVAVPLAWAAASTVVATLLVAGYVYLGRKRRRRAVFRPAHRA
jgi:beta-glucanase (GH16 family)